MTTQANIFSKTWCEVIFYNRNHNYGAYQIRQESGKRHLLALFITFVIISALLVIPKLVPETIAPKDPTIKEGLITLTTTPPVEKVVPPTTIIQPKPVEMFKNFRPTMTFVPPIITDDQTITSKDTVPTMETLNNSGVDIASFTSEGTENGEKRGKDDIVPVQETNSIYTSVETMPRFPGGDDELFKYLRNTLRYPQVAIDNQISETIYVQFVVYSTGEIGNVTIARGNDESCKTEAIRVIKKMHHWIPGKQNGNAVNVQMCLPVRFKLEN